MFWVFFFLVCLVLLATPSTQELFIPGGAGGAIWDARYEP